MAEAVTVELHQYHFEGSHLISIQVSEVERGGQRDPERCTLDEFRDGEQHCTRHDAGMY